tara:strand:+ start:610 stop:1215 length:606 start_codon:yes stop_codon:yes gene_type:complete
MVLRKIPIILMLAILLKSCITIEIGESGYRSLTSYEKNYIKPFEDAGLINSNTTNDSLHIFEINSEDLKSIIKKQDYTWIHIWNPYCSDESCINIEYFEKLENKYQHLGLNLVFISSTYDIQQITSTVKNSGFSKEVYVLESAYYGNKLKDMRKKLYFDLNPKANQDDNFLYDDFIFSNDMQIYKGTEINDSIIEVLIPKK